MMLIEDLLHHGEPYPLAVLFGAEEWRKEIRSYFLRDAAASIFDLDKLSSNSFSDPDRDRPFLADRFHGVLQDIDKYLLHLTSVHWDRIELLLNFPSPVYISLQAVGSHQNCDALNQS